MDDREQLKLEYSALLEEYKSLKSEIVANLDSARQVVGLTLTAIGVFIAIAPYVVESQTIILFLIAPLFFYGLAWTQLRYIYLALDMGTHLREAVLPRIQLTLARMHPQAGEDFSNLMGWDLANRSPLRLRRGGLRRLLFLPIAGANYGIPILASVLSVGTFLLLALHSSQPLSIIEVVLIAVNGIAFLYSIGWGVVAELGRG